MTVNVIKHRWPIIKCTHKGTPPYGYYPNEDKTYWYPIPEELDALEAAKDLLAAGLATRECATWLVEYTGKKISHQGLIKRINRDNKVYKGWSQEETRPEGLEWVLSEEDYGDGKIHWPESKPEARPQKNGRAKKSQLLKGKTPEEKQVIRAAHNVVEAKKKLTANLNKIARVVKKDEALEESLPSNLRESLPTLEDDSYAEEPDVIFQPHPGPQTEFLASNEDVIFYGGAKGGGKSYALIADPVRYFGNPNFRGLLLRRTTVELRDLIDKTKQLYPKVYPGAVYKVGEKVWEFPSGAKFEFGYCETEEDAERYRGQSYHWAGIDELPQYAHRGPFDAILSCVRSADPTLPAQLRCTGNPGNIGSQWVKEMFIDPSPPNTAFFKEASVTNPITGEVRVVKKSYRYIPATLYDNPSLLQDDSYLASLAMLPELKRKQMLEGDWDVVEEGAFPEFSRNSHVIKPFKIPDNWLKFRAADWGYSSPFCVLWMAVDFDNNFYVFREWYDQGIYDDDWAEEIAKWEIENKVYCEYGVIDGSISTSRGSRAEDSFEVINRIMRKHRLATFKKADRSPGSRKEGKLAMHRVLALKETGRKLEDGSPEMAPSFFIFDTCTNLIRTLPQLRVDPNDPELVMKKNSEDHCYDAGQYGVRSVRINNNRRFANLPFVTEKKWQPADKTLGY